MLIQIQETHPAGPGKKMATIVAADGQRYGVWPENLAKLRVGATFDVDVEQWESNGRTHQKITKFAPVNGDQGVGGTGKANGNGAAKANGNGHAPPAPNGEPEFVGRVLAAMIANGAVSLNGDPDHDSRQLYGATNMLRGLYGATFGLKNGGNAR